MTPGGAAMASPRARALVALVKAAPAGATRTPGNVLGSDALPPDQPPPAAEDDEHHVAPAVAAVTAVLAVYLGSKAAVGAVRLPPDLVRSLMDVGLNQRAIRAAARPALAHPLTGRTRHGSPRVREVMTARRRAAADEPLMRARYIVAAATRLTKAARESRWTPALRTERRYLQMHRAAGRKRRANAAHYDAAAARSLTGLMVWRTRRDGRVTADCRALEGRIFHADRPPAIPGVTNHIGCRCHAEPYVGPDIGADLR